MYTKEQFDRCEFNPLVNGRMLENYPRLAEIVNPQWIEDPNFENILRYVIMVYDPKSYLVENERDLNHRKGIAADLACIPLSENEEQDGIRDSIYSCGYAFRVESDNFISDFIEYLPDLITRYLCRFSSTKEWSAIVVTEHCYWESCRKLLEPISGKDTKSELEAVEKKSRIKDEIEKDIARLDKYIAKFFGEDEVLIKKVKRKGFSPESVAKAKSLSR